MAVKLRSHDPKVVGKIGLPQHVDFTTTNPTDDAEMAEAKEGPLDPQGNNRGNTVGRSIKKYAASGQPLEFLREPFKMRGSN